MPTLNTTFKDTSITAFNRYINNPFIIRSMKLRPIDVALSWMRDAGLNQTEFANMIDALPQDITNWKRRGLPADRYEAVASAFGKTVDALLSGDTQHVTAWDNKEDLPSDADRVWVDRWDFAFSAGNGGIQWEVRQKDALPFRSALFDAIGCSPKHCKLLMVKGDSMEPFLFDRDMIMIDTSKTEVRDGRIYAIHFEGEALVKQLFKQAGGSLTLHSYNNKYPDRLVNHSDMSTLAIAGEVVYRSGSGFL